MQDIKDLIKDYNRKVHNLRTTMNSFKKPNNTSSNSDYARLQTKMNCYRHFINQLKAIIKDNVE